MSRFGRIGDADCNHGEIYGILCWAPLYALRNYQDKI